MAVDVVVVNYKTDDLLAEFIKSYEEYRFHGCTLTVVDVESPQGPMERKGGPYAYTSTRTNIGYGEACNYGAQSGRGDVILLANADTLLTAGLLECYEALAGNPEWGVLGPRQVDSDNRITAGGIFGATAKSPAQRGWQEYDHGQYNDVRTNALSVSGALYFIKRSLWDELSTCQLYRDMCPYAGGAFLETRHYFEEMWCSTHARGHGYKCVFYGPVQMVHLWHRASPHGGWADNQFGPSQDFYRQVCAHHELECE